MPVGSEQSDPTNLVGWKPWLEATLRDGGGSFFPGALLLVAAWSNRKQAHRQGAMFPAAHHAEVSGVVGILGTSAADRKANPTPAQPP